MQSVIVGLKHNNKTVVKFIRDSFPSLAQSYLFKAFKQKDVKVNGFRVKEDFIVHEGDAVEVYIVDDILFPSNNELPSNTNKGFTVVYEDDNLLIVNKEQGIAVHPDAEQKSGTLIDLVREYVMQKPNISQQFRKDNSFPALCHRLDRNTGGLVMLALNQQTLDTIISKMQSMEIKKFYQCLVAGKMSKISDELRGYLFKDQRKRKVYISDTKQKGSLEIITRYKVLSCNRPQNSDIYISKLEIELLTGRTHQIRAHLAFIGHPVIGDGKYGTNAINRPLGVKQQALWAYKLVFDFKSDAGILNYLQGQSFKVIPTL